MSNCIQPTMLGGTGSGEKPRRGGVFEYGNRRCGVEPRCLAVSSLSKHAGKLRIDVDDPCVGPRIPNAVDHRSRHRLRKWVVEVESIVVAISFEPCGIALEYVAPGMAAQIPARDLHQRGRNLDAIDLAEVSGQRHHRAALAAADIEYAIATGKN